ncbi:unnamed protein product [Cylicocyclus nassatus]|uniref:C-type lectin n=1 Tax=Cylicocyclus nassatus TaxID=53992 RepID=A0AA36HG32_CYLNA|nr:unnamed protein product [Cylicocyclus nassatus]
MRISLITVILQGLLSTASNGWKKYDERGCEGGVTKLWLDVVAVIDNSLGMPEEGLIHSIGIMGSILDHATIAQGEGHHSRVGLVTYGSKADIRAKLTDFKSTEEFLESIWEIRRTNDSTSHLEAGLTAAELVFQEGRTNGLRKNVKEVIIVFASNSKDSHFNDSTHLANQTKNSGKHIIVVDFEQGGSGEPYLRQIASEYSYYNRRRHDLTVCIEMELLEANCFCEKPWIQYYGKYTKMGTCLRIGESKLNWRDANNACIHLSGGRGHLAVTLEKTKHNFIAEMVKNHLTTMKPCAYHIGLSYDSSKTGYFWEQPKGALPEKIPLEDCDFHTWNNGYPSLDGNATCVLATQISSDEFGWQNEVCDSWTGNYVCQMDACDADNYCPPD